jgi:HlyD family secretion protein
MTRRRVLVAGAALVLVAAAAVTAWRWWRAEPSAVLVASGTIEATEVDVGFRIAGRVVERPVREGEALAAGTLVARLESPELEAEVERLRAALEASRTRIPQLETEIAWRRELNRRQVEAALAAQAAAQERLAELRAGARPHEIAQARAILAAREARLAELRAGSRPQEIAQAAADLGEARAVLDQARSDFERVDRLARQGLVAEQDRDHARAALDVARQRHAHAEERLALVREGPRAEEIQRAEADVREARARLDLVVEGPRVEEIRRAEADLRQAEAAARLAQAGELEIQLRGQELATLRAHVARDRAALEAARAQLGYAVAHSPLAGVVLREHVEAGETVAAGTPVVTLADLRNTWLKIYVPETQLGWVKLGQRAEVTTDSFPGKVYPGTVTFVSSEAEFTPKNVQTQEERVKLVFAVKIAVDNPLQELKPGMPADARIRLE